MNIDTVNLEAASAAMLDERLPWESLLDEVEVSDYIFICCSATEETKVSIILLRI